MKSTLLLSELLALAGGLTTFAQPSAIAVVHSDGSRELLDLHAATPQTANCRLQQGDRVTVPTALVEITISGEVKLPGPYRFMPRIHTADLLALAGGATDSAALGSVRVIHPDGAIELVDASPPGDRSLELVLTEGDRVVVPTASARIAVLGNVHTPGYYPMDDRKPYKVSEAITHAGGMLEHSATSRIAVTHLVNGKAVKTIIDMSDSKHPKHPHSDPLLAPGDTVMVPLSSQPSWSDVTGSLSLLAILASLL